MEFCCPLSFRLASLSILATFLSLFVPFVILALSFLVTFGMIITLGLSSFLQWAITR